MLSRIDWSPLFLTFELAAVTTAILLVIGVPLALWLAGSRARWKPVAEALVSMPLVLPPSVLGFYLLLAFSPQSWLGHWLAATFDLRLVFTFEGLVLGSVLFSMPFMVHPLQSGFQSLPVSLTEAARTLGASRLKILFRVLLPNLKPSLLSGIVLAFAHTVGEFGVVLMIGGNIPGVTKVASIAIYDEVEALDYAAANVYAGVLFVLSFVVLLTVYIINKAQARAA
ncbi:MULTISPECIES: molybdate ABC transporter permease subunit [Microvirgula]|uniref:Molybdenum transport system permease n=1 Tax=Microvirgula aerodenitrificans TaxID=57480 RepID=A0A2S0P6M8_9NEIS|nr:MULTISPECIES: molybdate ABC transporter permease subunit [Microvirgula]AVY93040.1 molybdate ABC transporter permease subunit [Microvirgula aerodenitrificans]RAS12930.1 molybdate transport system permease protein [Microvirgula sp. AG722]